MMNVKCQRYLYEHRAVFLSETDLLTGIDIKALIQNAEKKCSGIRPFSTKKGKSSGIYAEGMESQSFPMQTFIP